MVDMDILFTSAGAFETDRYRESIEWVYFNPDADSGAQFVVTTIPLDMVPVIDKWFDKPVDLFDMLGECCNTVLIDIGDEDFPYYEKTFGRIEVSDKDEWATRENVNKLVAFAKGEFR